MENYKYYIQQGNQYSLKVQKGFLYIMIALVLGVAMLLFTIAANATNILIGLMFVALAILLFLRTSASTIINIDAKQIVVKAFSFSQPKIFHFKDYDGINQMSVSNYGVKGTSTVGMRFIVDGKAKEVRLLQSFMTTKQLYEVVKETEQIMGL
jgi:hypothetical protein